MKAVGYDSSTGAIQYLIKTICPVCKNIKESIHSSLTLYVCSDKIEERVCSQKCNLVTK